MPCHLIINAYDLGLAPGVTDAILDLAQRGRITSTSALMNLPGSSAALRRAREINLDVGLHLNICTGPPLSPPESVPSLLSTRATTTARSVRPRERE